MTQYENGAKSDRWQAKYWQGSITRREFQSIADQYGEAISNLARTTQKLDMVVSFLMEKGGFTVEQFQTWFALKTAEFAQLPTDTPKVTLD